MALKCPRHENAEVNSFSCMTCRDYKNAKLLDGMEKDRDEWRDRAQEQLNRANEKGRELESLRAQLEQARADCAAKDENIRQCVQECGCSGDGDHDSPCDSCRAHDDFSKAHHPSPGQPILERLRAAEKFIATVETAYHSGDDTASSDSIGEALAAWQKVREKGE